MSCRPLHNCIHQPKSQEPWTEPPSEEAVDPSGKKLIHQLLHRFCNSALEQTYCPRVFNVCWVILVFPIQGTLTWTTEYLTCAYYPSSSSAAPLPPPPPSSSSSSVFTRGISVYSIIRRTFVVYTDVLLSLGRSVGESNPSK